MSTSIKEATKSYHHGNLREVLLKQGLELLESTKGIDFSMRELTRMIGVSANAVYRHFANKEELLTALAIYGFEQLLTAQAMSIQNADNPQQGFLDCGREYINFAIQNPSLFHLMYGQFATNQNDEKLKSYANLFYTGMLYIAANAHNVSNEDPRAKILTARAWSGVHGLSHLIIDGQFSHLTPDELKDMINSVVDISMDNI